MSDESIAVDNSAESLMEEAPSEPIAEEIAPEPEPVQPTEPVNELFELPDGRKVDAETLSKEWKENFYPEYTRKSQALAEKEKLTTNKETPENPYADPNYVPQTYEEIIKAAEERALKTIEEREQSRIEAQQAIESEVLKQLNEIKSIDSTLNENALFLHANKYGFRDLKLAHQNMKDMSMTIKKVQTETAKNIAKRVDPVSTSPGATGQKSDPGMFGNAIEYLRSIK